MYLMEMLQQSKVGGEVLLPNGWFVCVLQEAGDNNQFCWRNLFSCINLLRILNKLTKWKHSRTMVRGRPTQPKQYSYSYSLGQTSIWDYFRS